MADHRQEQHCANASSSEESSSSVDDYDFDSVLDDVGGFGWYQALASVLVFLPAGTTGAIVLASVFTAAMPEYR